jgi:undecaprenyl-diphosphatase
VIATIASAISGYLTIGFLLKFLKSNSTFVFVFYRIILGAVIIFMLWNGIMNP